METRWQPTLILHLRVPDCLSRLFLSHLDLPHLLSILALGIAASVLLTPIVRQLAIRCDLLDRPDGRRKFHLRPIPLGGGLVVLFATTVTLLVAAGLWPSLRETLSEGWGHLAALGLAACLTCALGLIDDRIHLRAGPKLLGQLLIAMVIVTAGLQVKNVRLAGSEFELGLLAIPFTVVWIVAAMNALNLLDGMDGVATTVGIVISLALAAMCLMLPNREMEAVIALAMVGTLLGFLYFNFPPAKMFLGDAGSMVIGLVIGVLAIRSALKAPATIALAAPTAIFAIPLLDTSMAILRRKLTGQSFCVADRGHLHHCLVRKGISNRRTVVYIGALCAITSLAALAGEYQRDERLALIGTAAVVLMLITTRYFGHVESALLTNNLRRTVRGLFPLGRITQGSKATPQTDLTNGRHWQALLDIGDRFQLDSVRLTIEGASPREQYHAFPSDRRPHRSQNSWSVEVPLVAGSRSLGRVQLRGPRRKNSMEAQLSQLMAVVHEVIASIEADSSYATNVTPSFSTELPASSSPLSY